MLKTAQFYLIWFMYFCGAGAGLMFIGKLSTIASLQARIDLGFLIVALLAIGNGAGRIIAGIISDKIGRKFTMLIFLLFQALLIFLLSLVKEGNFLATPIMMAVISAFIGFNYGTNLSLFPAITKDFYGLKNFGVNYGLVFTAWGFAGFLLSLLLSSIYDSLKSFTIAYYIMAALLVIAAVATLMVKKPQKNT
jgi:OFA family oxalate/formate antiporter-like MFS transporter